MTAGRRADPFGTLGLRADAEVSDDDVRAAWRRVAAATHPDRADGGDPERFALAAAAYTELRTAFGRGETRAGLDGHDAEPTAATRSRLAWPFVLRLRTGRPGRLLLRVAVAVAAGLASVLAAGPSSPAGPALAVGAFTWLLLTARRDLGPRN